MIRGKDIYAITNLFVISVSLLYSTNIYSVTNADYDNNAEKSKSVNTQTKVNPLDLRKSDQFFSPMGTYQIGLADFDSDGDLDAAFSNMPYHSQVMLNDGNGYFQQTSQSLAWGLHGIACGDVDDDDDIDLFFVSNRADDFSSPLYLNDGQGSFVQSSVDLGDYSRNGAGIQLVDIENDGDLDVTLEYAGDDRLVYLNDGQGHFINSGLSLPEISHLHDLNSDGFVDVFAREQGSGFRVYMNDQTGNFYPFSFFPVGDIGRGSVAFTDVEKDGDLDVIYTVSEAPTAFARLLLNNGLGEFTDSGQELAFVGLTGIGSGDLNGDGFVELVFTNFYDPPQVWQNDGQGGFFDTGIRLTGNGFFNICEIEDVDNDGDNDIFISNYDQGENGLWFNDTPISNTNMCGDVNNDQMTDILDIIFMIDSKFKDGPLPDPLYAADVNSDGIYDILDIVHLIDWKFKDGPDPVCLL